MNETTSKVDRESLRILVVDDNPHVLSALVDLFEDQHDLSVVGAALREDDAITLALSHRPDVVLVDVHMPQGGGQHVITAVRRHLPSTWIVALSASVDRADCSRMLSTGADVYSSKSADVTSLVRSLTP